MRFTLCLTGGGESFTLETADNPAALAGLLTPECREKNQAHFDHLENKRLSPHPLAKQWAVVRTWDWRKPQGFYRKQESDSQVKAGECYNTLAQLALAMGGKASSLQSVYAKARGDSKKFAAYRCVVFCQVSDFAEVCEKLKETVALES